MVCCRCPRKLRLGCLLPMPAALLPTSRPGYFYMNTYKPETRPEYEITSLILHEAVPGHTFQGGIAIELKDIPKFRRYGGYSAHQEGWGPSFQTLGQKTRFYDEPLLLFAKLRNEK